MTAAAALARRYAVVLRVPARLESIRVLTGLVSNLARRARLSDEAIHHCRLALDEACMNIIRHAYGQEPGGEIEVAVEIGEGECVIYLTDFGESYDPSQVAKPRIGESIDDARPGGLGLYLMRSVMSEVRYIPGPNRNCLVMVKRE
jgi:serine/threonine-protein kinase RsbW